MIFNVGLKQRNYNLIQLIKNYNRLFRTHKSNPLPQGVKYELMDGLIGDEAVSDIENDLFYSDNVNSSELGLIYSNKGKYYLSYENLILPVSTKEEAVVIYNMLINGDFDLFMDDKSKSLLEENIKKYFKNIGVKDIPVLKKYISYKSEPLLEVALNKIKSNFDTVSNAIKEKQLISFDYYYDNKSQRISVFPTKIVFSHIDRKLRVKALIGGTEKTFYLDYMSNISNADYDSKSFTLNPIASSKTKELILKCKNEANVIERIAARFSDYKKTVTYNHDDNTLCYHIFYDDNPKEMKRVIIRLQYLETRVEVLSGEKHTLKNQALDTLMLYIQH